MSEFEEEVDRLFGGSQSQDDLLKLHDAALQAERAEIARLRGLLGECAVVLERYNDTDECNICHIGHGPTPDIGCGSCPIYQASALLDRLRDEAGE